jgi:hypothetical protein
MGIVASSYFLRHDHALDLMSQVAKVAAATLGDNTIGEVHVSA